MVDGAVTFLSLDGGTHEALGQITPEGTYSLKTTFLNGDTVEGAVVGRHRVVVYGPSAADHSSRTYTLKKEVTVEQGDNRADVQLAKPDP